MKVYYTKSMFFHAAILGAIPDKKQFPADYALVAEINGPDATPEYAFYLLNDEPEKYIKTLPAGVSHTSMSVGDIVEINGVYSICQPVGWQVLKGVNHASVS